MASAKHAHEHESTGDGGGTESRSPIYAPIDPLELRWRREWNEARDERIAMSLELAKARYLLKRIANWTPYPVENAQEEARMFLKTHKHHPPEWGKQEKLL